jgi:hypothetical protein
LRLCAGAWRRSFAAETRLYCGTGVSVYEALSY